MIYDSPSVGPVKYCRAMEEGWVVVGPTQGGFFIGYVNIILLCMWLTVCGCSEILQDKEGGWVVVDPTHGGSFVKYTVTINGVWLMGSRLTGVIH